MSVIHLGRPLDRRLLQVSVRMCLAEAVGLCWPAIGKLRPAAWVSSTAEASINPPVSRCLRFSRCHGKGEASALKFDPFSSSTYAPSGKPRVLGKARTRAGRAAAASPVARTGSRSQKKHAERPRAPAKHAVAQPKPSPKPGVRLASLEDEAPPLPTARSRILSGFGTLTSLEDFDTAPFPITA